MNVYIHLNSDTEIFVMNIERCTVMQIIHSDINCFLFVILIFPEKTEARLM